MKDWSWHLGVPSASLGGRLVDSDASAIADAFSLRETR